MRPRRIEMAVAGWAIAASLVGGAVAIAGSSAVSTSAEPLVSACVTLQIVGADPICIVI